MVSDDEQIRGDIIKKGFEELNILGPTLKEEMISYIQRRGNPLDAAHTYTLREMKIELRDVFGDDATALLVDRLRHGVEALLSLVILSAPVACLFLVSAASDPSSLGSMLF